MKKYTLDSLEKLGYKKFIKIGLDLFSIILGVEGAFLLKYGLEQKKYFNIEYLMAYGIAFVFFYKWNDLECKSWRYVNSYDILEILKTNLWINGLANIVIFSMNGRIVFSLALIIMFISVEIQMLGRLYFRIKRFRRDEGIQGKKENIIIYGAGEAGITIAKEHLTNPDFPYNVIGFIDDDKKKIGTIIYNIRVLGDRGDLNFILSKEKIDKIFLAMPSIDSEKLKKIIRELKLQEKVEIKILPTVSELFLDRSMTSQVRKIKIEDLLDREEIKINSGHIKNVIENKVVFITGGAGSIGSELARQISKFNPKQLINIDVNENDLYFLDLELRRKYPDLNLVSEICNIREKKKLEFLFDKYRPDILFHAAAHKHVPLMEHNPEEAIKNNIFGTKNLVECAERYEVERVVLISTDKAVNPTNIMGATKRVCELIIRDMNKRSKKTKYMAVRFGNVLGSNGSVVPIFKKLIEEGKNITLTHPDITRYFMTISEAAQLVIEAGSMGNGGEIFILDMGKPIKIYDLAKTMLKLSNSEVGIDIVGLRPGEKLYEELLYDTSIATKTENKKIFITPIVDGHVDVNEYYEKLEKALENPKGEEIKKIMKNLVISYKEVEYN